MINLNNERYKSISEIFFAHKYIFNRNCCIRNNF